MRRMRSDTRCRHRRAVGEGAVVARELDGGGHGGRALVCVRAKEERQGGRERGREAWRHPGARSWSSRARGDAWHGGRTRGGNETRALLHGCHGALSSNTW